MRGMKKPEVHKKADEEKGERIAKILARSGVASRRAAEAMILEGRITVDGETLTTPAFVVRGKPVIAVDGKTIDGAAKTKLWRYHKPAGLITTAKDPQGRPTVFDHLPKSLPRVVSVGRLDLNSEGLLLLTNDGELARHLELPQQGWLRRYRVRVHLGSSKQLTQEMLDKLKDGVKVEGVAYGPIEATLDNIKGHNAWVTMALKEGKNREIRKVMNHLGFNVNRLIRLAFGPFQLGKLEEGMVEEIPARVLKDQIPSFFGEAS